MQLLKRRTRATVPPDRLGVVAMEGDPIGPSNIWPAVQAFNAGWGWSPSWSPYLGERIGTVSRCLQLNAQQVATLPLNLRGPTSTPAWMNNPDPEIYNGLADAIFAATWTRYARGESFLYVTSRYADGYPATWVVLDPVTMNVEWDVVTGARTYKSNDYPLRREDVLHVMRDPRPGQLHGTPALSAYYTSLVSAIAAEEFAGSFFSQSGVPATVLKYGAKLKKEQAEELQAQWVAAVASRAGAPAVLDQGLDFSIISFSPKDLMLLELREYDAKQLASAFGVPAFLLNMQQAGGLQYTNPAQLFDLWWRAELMPCAAALETALSTWLPAGNWVVFDPSVILRPDFATLASTWLALLDKGAVSVDEVRANVLNLPPMEDADETFGQPASAQSSAPVALGVVNS